MKMPLICGLLVLAWIFTPDASRAADPAPALSTAALAAVAASSSAAGVVRYEAPQAPAHAQRTLDNVTDLSRDLAETVAFLETGQSYFRAFTKGSHNAAENKLFVKFLDAYERELATAKKETAVLREWLEKASALK
ncbi:MAG TPA: hypothetical protein DEB40_00970 [Elusimicrobia bacterium]|nr:hypothetical protein [Elusimicrobiota bacterium]HBT60301.1 hypothetical protein [Elusimicrobiota bacterium]